MIDLLAFGVSIKDKKMHERDVRPNFCLVPCVIFLSDEWLEWI